MAFDELLIRHCAPTLADLKIASLICIPKSVCGEEYEQIVSAYNDCYNGKGVYFRTLCICNRRRLLYVYRPCRVRAYLASPAAAAFLVECGFAREASLEEKLSLLADRFTSSNAFPHELGLFLGYPTADVEAFIVHGGSREKLCGEWKAYTNTAYAAQEFHKYNCCRIDYWQRFSRGMGLDTLIVA